mgnify:CR=1 FL=1
MDPLFLNKTRVGEICRAAEADGPGGRDKGLRLREGREEEGGHGKNGNCEYKAVRSDRLSGLWKDHGVIKASGETEGSRIGVIQNEFGKLGIDGTILRNDDIQMVEINRGSIFCTCQKLNFVKALADMAQQDFDYLFVESSGWGDPSNVQEILDAARIRFGKGIRL